MKTVGMVVVKARQSGLADSEARIALLAEPMSWADCPLNFMSSELDCIDNV